MKNLILLSILLAPLAIFGQAMNNSLVVGKAEEQKNTAANNEFLKALQTGDVSKLGDVAAPEFANHGVGEKIGPDSLKASIRQFYKRFKPVKIEVIKRLTDGEYFSDWVRYTGANPAMVIEGIEMTRYSNGKAMEHWFFPNAQTMRRPIQ